MERSFLRPVLRRWSPAGGSAWSAGSREAFGLRSQQEGRDALGRTRVALAGRFAYGRPDPRAGLQPGGRRRGGVSAQAVGEALVPGGWRVRGATQDGAPEPAGRAGRLRQWSGRGPGGPFPGGNSGGGRASNRAAQRSQPLDSHVPEAAARTRHCAGADLRPRARRPRERGPRHVSPVSSWGPFPAVHLRLTGAAAPELGLKPGPTHPP